MDETTKVTIELGLFRDLSDIKRAAEEAARSTRAYVRAKASLGTAELSSDAVALLEARREYLRAARESVESDLFILKLFPEKP